MQNITNHCFYLILLLLVSACTAVTAQRGNLLEDYKLENVKVDEHTRSDILRLLGSPTTQSTFNPNVWYYLGQVTQKKGILDDQVVNERIVSVTFDQDGIVRDVSIIEDAREDIPVARDKTPTHGNELTFIQQLLGNVGKFNTPDSSPTDLGR